MNTKNSQVLEYFLSQDGVLRLNMNDPLNLNALSENMIDLMHKHLEKAAKNKDKSYYYFC